jgi:hypothetical protein
LFARSLVRPSTRTPEILITKARNMMTKNFALRDRKGRLRIEAFGAAKVFILASP